MTSGSTTRAGSKETLLTSSYDTLPSLGTNFSNNKGENIQHNPHCCEPQELGIVGHQDRLQDDLAETVAPPPRLEHEESFKESSQSDDEESKSGAIELMKRGGISRPSQFLSKDWEHKKQRLPDISLAIKLHDDEGHTYTFWPSTKLCELSHDEHLISGGAILAQEKMISSICQACGKTSHRARIENLLEFYAETDVEEEEGIETGPDCVLPDVEPAPAMGTNPILKQYSETSAEDD